MSDTMDASAVGGGFGSFGGVSGFGGDAGGGGATAFDQGAWNAALGGVQMDPNGGVDMNGAAAAGAFEDMGMAGSGGQELDAAGGDTLDGVGLAGLEEQVADAAGTPAEGAGAGNGPAKASDKVSAQAASSPGGEAANGISNGAQQPAAQPSAAQQPATAAPGTPGGQTPPVQAQRPQPSAPRPSAPRPSAQRTMQQRPTAPQTSAPGTSAGLASGCQRYNGRAVGSGQCVALVQAADSRLGLTATWRQGAPVRGNTSLRPGTPIATFDGNGRYGNHTDGSSHAAIYLGQNAQGIQVMDQWRGQPAHYRTIRWAGGRAANSGNAFHVINH